MDDRDADRLELLDRLAEGMADLKLDARAVEWIEMPDGAQGLAVDGGGFAGDGAGFIFANAGEDVHAIGPTEPADPRWHRLRRNPARRQPLSGSG